jgi:hypothetical protein
VYPKKVRVFRRVLVIAALRPNSNKPLKAMHALAIEVNCMT